MATLSCTKRSWSKKVSQIMSVLPQPKKMMALCILDILNTYTDAEHRMSQKEIAQKLKSDYDMDTDRKTLRRNLENLIDFGCDIEFTKTVRVKKDGAVEELATDWYINHDFTDSELRLLIDSLLFSGQVPSSQKKKLINKLQKLSSKYFRTRTNHIHSLPEVTSTNKQLFYTIEVLDEAISKHKKVSINLGNYDTNGKLHPRKTNEGKNKEYRVNPYQIVAASGRYYLVCNYDGFDSITNSRLDRILNIKICDESVRQAKELPGFEQGFNLPKHMAEHIYMTYGESVKVRFRCKLDFLVQVFDWFGNGVQFANTTDTHTECLVTVNENAMEYWCLQFCKSVEVLAPESLRKRLLENAESMLEMYS